MQYERPEIVRRDRIEALLDTARPSDLLPKTSDVNAKDNIVAVSWGPASERTAYEYPSIARRDSITALLGTARPSDVEPDNNFSDVNLKDNIVAVSWGSASERAAYELPSIARRDSIAGLLFDGASPSDVKQADGESDVNLKDNIVAVSWGSASERAAYELPSIARRDSIAGLLAPVTPSDVDERDSQGASDVRLKDNIVAVSWGSASERTAYELPSIVRRDSIAGLLTVAAPSDVKADS